MASKDKKKSGKPDRFVPPWEQTTSETSADDASDDSGDGSAEADSPEEATDKKGKTRSKGGIPKIALKARRKDKGTASKDAPKTPKSPKADRKDKDTASGDAPKKSKTPRRKSGVRSRLSATVVVIDGNKLTTTVFKADKVVSVAEQDYDTETEALQAAISKSGRKLLVWCGGIAARVARPVDTSEHPDVVRLADARYLAKVFGSDHLAAMSGTVAMAPDPQDEVAKILATSTTPRAVLAGMCVNLEEEGIWLRVGRTSAEATLVHDGRINGWATLCEGLNSVAERIRQGQSPANARADLADQVVTETRKVIMQWQRTRTVPPWIWLHGPGGDPSGEVHQALLLHSGCRVAAPPVEEPADFGLTQYTPLLPLAVHSLTATRLQRPERTLQESSRIKKRQMITWSAVAAVVLAAMAGYSSYIGRQAKARIAEADARIAAANQRIPEADRQLVDQAIAVRPVLDLLNGSSSPDWELMFRLQERFPPKNGLLALQASRLNMSITAKACCDGLAEYKALSEELENWAKVIFGSGARAQLGMSGEENADGTVSVGAILLRQE